MRINRIKNIAITLLLATTICGCQGNGDDSAIQPVTYADSVSVAYGDVVGAQLNMTFSSLSDEHLDRDAFMEGVRRTIMAATSEPGVIEGLWKGLDIGEQLDYYSAVGIDLNRKALVESFTAAMCAPSIDTVAYEKAQSDYDRILNSVQHLVLEKMRENRRKQMVMAQNMRNANIEAANKYVDELCHTDTSVVKTASGLCFKPIVSTSGQQPRKGSMVDVRYSISTIDGRLIDSSRGDTVRIEIGGSTIQGLQEGLPMMSVGSKYRFYVPSHLGFVRSTPGIEPGQMVVVDIELIKI